MRNKTVKNLGFQTVYQIIVTITPLITSPYLSRVLHPEGIGIFSYTQSMVNYFMLFAMLGFINYGTRAIASCRDNKEKRSTFSEIYFIQFIVGTLSLLFFILFSIVYKDYTVYLLLQSFWIVGCIFDVSWYFFGKEEFKTTVSRNLIVKLLTIASIFTFVKTDGDIWKYILIMSSSHFLSGIILWPKLLKEQKIQIAKWNKIKKHIKPILVLFVPILAMSVYTIMDKTMLGALSTSSENGYYYNSDKIVNIPLGIITGIGTVMLAKITSDKSKEGSKKAIELIKRSITPILRISIALAFGIAAISNDFVPFFFGDDYIACVSLVKLFSIVIVLKTISNIIRTQYLVPFNKEKIFIISVIIGAITNLVTNFILIYIFNMGALGATIGTLVAEVVVTILEIVLIRKELKISKELIKTIPCIIVGTAMFATVYLISNTLNMNIVVKLIIEIMAGGIIYIVLSATYICIYDKESLSIVKGILPIRRQK